MKRLIIFILGMLVLSSMVFADNNLMSLQSKVLRNGLWVDDGNLTVLIYDAASGGNLVYNSSNDYINAVQNGFFDVMLGNGSALNLTYGKRYFMDIFINGEDMDFNGNERREFESGVGNITGGVINFGAINGSHLASNIEINTTGNITLGQKLVFALGGIIDNIVNGLITINSNLNVTGGLNVTGSALILGNLNVTGNSFFGSQSFASIDASGNINAKGNLTINNSVFFVNGDTGNVGIGTTGPSEKLEVAGNLEIHNNMTIGASVTTENNGIITLQVPVSNVCNSSDLYIRAQNGPNTNPAVCGGGVRYGGDLYLDGGWSISGAGYHGNVLMSTRYGGNVGIGTTSPSEKLSVKGNVSLNNTLYVLENGNVGIGTANPGSRLHVIGNTNVSENLTVEGQCVTGDTLLSMADGSEKKIVDVKAGEYVLSLNEETQQIEPHRINGLLDMGNKTIFELVTESGRAINTTGNHPYLALSNWSVVGSEPKTTNQELLTKAEWIKVSELEVGDEIAVPAIDYDKVYSQEKPNFLASSLELNTLTNEEITGLESTTSSIYTNPLSLSSLSLSFLILFPSSIANLSASAFDNLLFEVKDFNSSSFNLFDLSKSSSNAFNSIVFAIKPDQLNSGDSFISLFNSSGISSFNSTIMSSPEAYNKENYIKLIIPKPASQAAMSAQDPDIFFDKIVSIKVLEPQHVYDIEVEGTHNFIANGIVAHNTYMNGKVGIGTTSPLSKLDISQGATTSTNIDHNDTPTYDGGFAYNSTYLNVSSITGFPTAGTLIIDSEAISYTGASGNQFTGLTRGVLGTSAANHTNTTAVYYLTASITKNLSLTPQMVVRSDGKVGIGTTTPEALLHVSGGDIQLDNNRKLLFKDAQGTIRTAISWLTDNGLQINTAATSGGAYIKFTNAGNEKMRIDNSGNVGIGTTSPTATLQVNSSNAAGAFAVYNASGTGNYLFVNGTSGKVGIGTTSPTTKLTVKSSIAGTDELITIKNNAGTDIGYLGKSAEDSVWYLLNSSGQIKVQLYSAGNSYFNGGNVGIGTTTPGDNLEVAEAGTNSQSIIIETTNNDQTDFPSDFIFRKSHSDTLGLKVATIDTTILGRLQFMGVDSEIAFDWGAYIEGVQNGAVGTKVPTDLRFLTSTDSVTSEAMRISSSGNVGIGTTSPGATLHSNGTFIHTSVTNSTTVFQVKSKEGTVVLDVDTTNSRVGIGTTSPNGTLHVRGAQGDVIVQDLTAVGGMSSSDQGVLFENAGSGIRSGSFTEVNGEILSYAINKNQLGGRNDSKTGGIFRLDIRGTAVPYGSQFVIKRDPSTAGDSDISTFAINLENGMTYVEGSLGIGTASARDKLEVNGSFRVTNASNDAVLLYVNQTTGNVGIGTSSPGVPLEVYGGNSTTLTRAIVGNLYPNSDPSVSGGGVALRLISGTGRTSAIDFGHYDSTGNYVGTWGTGIKRQSNGTDFWIWDGTDDTNRFTIVKSTGNVGINTTSPQATFQVNGTSLFMNGNIGIGTTSPSSIFHVLDPITTSATPKTVATLETNNDGVGAGPELLFKYGSGADSLFLSKIRSVGGPGSYGGSLRFFTEPSGADGTDRLVERVTILDSGNVGIGTTNPGTILHLNSSGDTNLRIESTINAPLIQFMKNNIGKWLIVVERNTPAYGMSVDDFGIMRQTDSSPLLMIKNSTGNVGIGTTNPLNKTHIAQSTGTTAYTVFEMLRLSTSQAGAYADNSEAIVFQNYDSGNSHNRGNMARIVGGQYGADATSNAAGTGHGYLAFETAGHEVTTTTERMRIDMSGNVGIGTTSPTAKLEVRGEVRTTDSSGNARVWGEGRPNAVRYGTSGVESGLCTNGSISFGLSLSAVEWGDVSAACPAGTWICTLGERGTSACDTARSDSTLDGMNCGGTAQDWASNAHRGWLADANVTYPTYGANSYEDGTIYIMPTCSIGPTWCCS